MVEERFIFHSVAHVLLILRVACERGNYFFKCPKVMLNIRFRIF